MAKISTGTIISYQGDIPEENLWDIYPEKFKQ